MKFRGQLGWHLIAMSPSTRREWIEIRGASYCTAGTAGLPPHGGSGLKFNAPEYLVKGVSLPPHGGSGLKSASVMPTLSKYAVSLHTEGVD